MSKCRWNEKIHCAGMRGSTLQRGREQREDAWRHCGEQHEEAVEITKVSFADSRVLHLSHPFAEFLFMKSEWNKGTAVKGSSWTGYPKRLISPGDLGG